MKKEQYEFCLFFYDICNRYLNEDLKKELNNEEVEEKNIRFFKKLKLELEKLLYKGDIIKEADVIITNEFYDAYDLALMLHTYIDCIPEEKVYLLKELFTFLKKYKIKIEENDYLTIWQEKIKTEEKKENLSNIIKTTKLKRKIIIALLLTGAITTSAVFIESKTCQKIIDNITEFFSEEDVLNLELKK